MGLDMYLEARKNTFVGRYIDDSDGEVELKLPEELKDFEDIWHNVITINTTYGIGYWRKANHIHNWFVKHCGDGEDNQQDMRVSLGDFEELLDVCNKVLEDHSKAEELLPTCDGFFFGSTRYDEKYFNDVEYTKKVCEAAIKLLKTQLENKTFTYEIHYQADW